MTDALLEVRGLRVGYGELPVLQGIDFDVEAGSRTVLLGLNGAGKTTTVSAIAGLLKPWKGTITFDGQRIDGRDPAVLVERGIALVPEGRRCFPALTVAQNLRLGTWTKRGRKAEIDETAWAELNSTISRPFPRPEHGRICVKVINHFGDEVQKVFTV